MQAASADTTTTRAALDVSPAVHSVVWMSARLRRSSMLLRSATIGRIRIVVLAPLSAAATMGIRVFPVPVASTMMTCSAACLPAAASIESRCPGRRNCRLGSL